MSVATYVYKNFGWAFSRADGVAALPPTAGTNGEPVPVGLCQMKLEDHGDGSTHVYVMIEPKLVELATSLGRSLSDDARRELVKNLTSGLTLADVSDMPPRPA